MSDKTPGCRRGFRKGKQACYQTSLLLPSSPEDAGLSEGRSLTTSRLSSQLHRRRLGHDRRAGIKIAVALHNLAGARGVEAKFASHQIDTVRIGKYRLGQAELPILLFKLNALLLFGFHLIPVFNSAEVLEAVKHHDHK